jgi:hypothetical protein
MAQSAIAAHEAEAAGEQRRNTQGAIIVAVVSVLVLAAVGGVYLRSRAAQAARAKALADVAAATAATAAPLCSADNIKSGVVELLLENAMREVDPAVAQKYDAPKFAVTDVTERPSTDVTQRRECVVTIVHKPSAEARAFIQGYLDGTKTLLDRRISDADVEAGASFLRNTWHASAQQVELSLQFEIARDTDDVAHGWTLNFNAFQQTGLDSARAGLYLMAVGAESSGSAPK